MSNKTIAELRGVTKKYQVGETEIQALNNVNFSVSKGDFIVVAGPSGSGKSTFLNILGSIDKPTSGTILFNGTDITHLNLESLHQLRLNKIGFVFQSFNLVPVLTAYENVELPLLFKNISKKEIKERVTTVLEKVGLQDRMDHLPARLSGGQKQRVAIARALVGSPELIIADEPTANLDRKTAISIMELIGRLNEEDRVTIIVASHDPYVIEKAKAKIVIQDGKILKEALV
jgi:putative ABC transport system ATP-binding protein